MSEYFDLATHMIRQSKDRDALLSAALAIRNIPPGAAGAATECIRIAKEALAAVRENHVYLAPHMTPDDAKRIIAAVMDATADVSRALLHEGRPLIRPTGDIVTLVEAEKRMDAAIAEAWLSMTGETFPAGQDPVQFVFDSLEDLA
jgi:hypothetical protein